MIITICKFIGAAVIILAGSAALAGILAHLFAPEGEDYMDNVRKYGKGACGGYMAEEE